MKKETVATMLKIYFGESDQYKGQSTYKFLAEYLKKNNFAGVTVFRGIEGFGRKSVIHTSSLLDLSSDLPVMIELVDQTEKVEELKKFLDENNVITSGLVTEETVKIIQYGSQEKRA